MICCLCLRLQPKGALSGGVYSGTCGTCHSKIKFRVNEARAPTTTSGCGATDGCCSSGDKGCCGGKKACGAHKAKVHSPDPVSAISFTLNGNQVSGAIAGLQCRLMFDVVVGDSEQPRSVDDAQ